MYLAQREDSSGIRFAICRSYRQDLWWRSEELVDLGADPSRVLIPNDRGGFGVEDWVRAALLRRRARPRPGELERLLLPFVPERFQERRRPLRSPPLEAGDEERLTEEIFLFDRRRYFFLISGLTDLAGITILPVSLFTPLADKSRDEIEQLLLSLEKRLHPSWHQPYVFTAFNLQHFLLYLQERTMPPSEDHHYLDELFLTELCRINHAPWFWMEDHPPERLHPYLRRYLYMYFDEDQQEFWQEYLHHFMAAHDFYGPATENAEVGGSETEELFGRSMAQLKSMSSKELTHLYKQRARRFHPDQGGDPGKFIQLTEAYEGLLQEQSERDTAGV